MFQRLYVYLVIIPSSQKQLQSISLALPESLPLLFFNLIEPHIQDLQFPQLQIPHHTSPSNPIMRQVQIIQPHTLTNLQTSFLPDLIRSDI